MHSNRQRRKEPVSGKLEIALLHEKRPTSSHSVAFILNQLGLRQINLCQFRAIGTHCPGEEALTGSNK